jgi:hypothetical protein
MAVEFAGGVIIGADSRTTTGSYIVSSFPIHFDGRTAHAKSCDLCCLCQSNNDELMSSERPLNQWEHDTCLSVGYVCGQHLALQLGAAWVCVSLSVYTRMMPTHNHIDLVVTYANRTVIPVKRQRGS